MTGFASIRGSAGERVFLLEAKSVNHRFCEVNVRLPGKYSAWDLLIQKEVKKRFQRGRIDIFLKEVGSSGLSATDFSKLKKAHQQLKQIARSFKLNDNVTVETLLNFHRVYFQEEDRFNASREWSRFSPMLDRLLARLAVMRVREGRELHKWFREQLPRMGSLLKTMKRRSMVLPKKMKQRLIQRVKESDNLVLEDRVSAEIALLADKIDVTEEIVRLDTHLRSFRSMLREGGLIGRKIDFLMQELGREINTVASKSQDSEISTCAVQFKAEIEKIREQAGNVE